MDVTILGVDLPEIRFDAPLPGGVRVEGDTDEEDAPPGIDGLRPLVVLGVVVGLALLARYLRRSESHR